MDPRLKANRANWNDRVGIPATSRFYDVDGWLRDAPLPPPEETNVVGDVTDKTVVHQPVPLRYGHSSLGPGGADATGVDFPPAAVREATLLTNRAGLADHSRFVCVNAYDAPAALHGERFGVVYVSLGSLCGLPDVPAPA
jgi:hypothetical protein